MSHALKGFGGTLPFGSWVKNSIMLTCVNVVGEILFSSIAAFGIFTLSLSLAQADVYPHAEFCGGPRHGSDAANLYDVFTDRLDEFLSAIDYSQLVWGNVPHLPFLPILLHYLA